MQLEVAFDYGVMASLVSFFLVMDWQLVAAAELPAAAPAELHPAAPDVPVDGPLTAPAW